MVLLVQSALFKYPFWKKFQMKLPITFPLMGKVSLNDLSRKEINRIQVLADYWEQAVNKIQMKN